MTRKRKALSSIVAAMLSLCGCADSDSPDGPIGNDATLVSETTISGFDPSGEPVIRVMSDGTLHVLFEAMPPFFAEDFGIETEFDDFRAKLESAAGVPVSQDDRELFIIEAPSDNTISRIKLWLELYPKPNAG